MLTFLSKIFKINSIQVVGIYQETDSERYTLLTFKKEKNQLKLIENKSFISKKTFLENIDLKLPIVLAIDGKGVLNKKIDSASDIDLAWQKNIDFNTIYHTSYTLKNNIFISFCRKNVADEWLSFFESKKAQIIDVYIGSFLSVLLADNLSSPVVYSGDLALVLEQNEIVNFSKPEAIPSANYTIGEHSVSNFAMPLYGIGLNYFVQNDSISKSEFNNNSIDEVVYRKAFSTFGLIMLVGFLITLLASYLSIQYYSEKNAALNIQNVYSNKAYQQIVTLEKQKKDKEKIIKDSGFLSDKFLSFYSYEIIKSIPNSISLNELNTAPLQKVVKHNEKVEITPGTIWVKGVTVNEDEFNNWLRSLKSFHWIAKFELESLKKDKKNNTQFSLKIRIK
jgi:Tfp pilus assembly protein PilN